MDDDAPVSAHGARLHLNRRVLHLASTANPRPRHERGGEGFKTCMHILAWRSRYACNNVEATRMRMLTAPYRFNARCAERHAHARRREWSRRGDSCLLRARMRSRGHQ